MADPQEILNEIGAQQGWSADSKLEVALEYIRNQQDDQAFEDHVKQVAASENEG